MEVKTGGLGSAYEIEQLARVFFPGALPRKGPQSGGELVLARAGRRRLAAGVRSGARALVYTAPAPKPGEDPKTPLSRLLYDVLCEFTGLRPPWGLLTGVRPVRLYRNCLRAGGEAAAKARLLAHADVLPEKYAMLREISARQAGVLGRAGPRACCVYVSIPFCPSRCDYCSFVSRTIQREGHLVEPYLDALEAELAATARLAGQLGLWVQALYVGGGTPTALSPAQLKRLLAALGACFNTAGLAEYTVEAGRPDCTGPEKLALLKEFGVGRLSINPQTLQDDVLQNIGRAHTGEQALRCFGEARAAGHESINMDLIAGLPGDTPEGFAHSLAGVVQLEPENITLHTLTLKRASNLVVDGRGGASSPTRMLEAAYPALRQSGYAPYYLYRQKNTVENLENTGWTKPGREGVYNILTMEEETTILAAGAAAGTKLVAGGGRFIERVFNPKFPADYIQNIDEILQKKEGVKRFYARYLDSQEAR